MTWDRIILLVAALCVIMYIVLHILIWSVSITSAVNANVQRLTQIEHVLQKNEHK